MALDPYPITLTSVAADDYEGHDPQPFVVVGDAVIPEPQPAIANQANAGTLADLAAAQTAINSLTAKVNSILAALRSAGILGE